MYTSDFQLCYRKYCLKIPFIEFLGMAKPPWGRIDVSSWKIAFCRPIFSDIPSYSPLLRNPSAACRIPTRGYGVFHSWPPPLMAGVKCLTLRSNLGPETSAHPDLGEQLERQANTASVISSLLLCLSDTTLSGKNRRLSYTSHHWSWSVQRIKQNSFEQA